MYVEPLTLHGTFQNRFYLNFRPHHFGFCELFSKSFDYFHLSHCLAIEIFQSHENCDRNCIPELSQTQKVCRKNSVHCSMSINFLFRKDSGLISLTTLHIIWDQCFHFPLYSVYNGLTMNKIFLSFISKEKQKKSNRVDIKKKVIE